MQSKFRETKITALITPDVCFKTIYFYMFKEARLTQKYTVLNRETIVVCR